MSQVVVLEVEQIWGPKIFQCETEDTGDWGRGQGTSRSRCWMSCPYICWLQTECLLRVGIEWKNGPTARVPGEYRGISRRPRDDSDRKVKVTLIGVPWFLNVSKGAGIWGGGGVCFSCLLFLLTREWRGSRLKVALENEEETGLAVRRSVGTCPAISSSSN